MNQPTALLHPATATLLHAATETAFDRAAARLDQLEKMPAGAALHAELIALQAMPLGSAAAVRANALWTKVISHCQARAMITVAEAINGVDLLVLASGHDAKQIIGEEIAAMTHVTSGAAIDQVYLVDQVGETLPLSWEALDRGDVTLEHLKRLAGHRALPAESRAGGGRPVDPARDRASMDPATAGARSREGDPHHRSRRCRGPR